MIGRFAFINRGGQYRPTASYQISRCLLSRYQSGNADDPIFKADRDREKFLEYLATVTDRFSIFIHSYCLMTNHYQLLIETPQANLSAATLWLNVSYATWFNKEHKRQGPLFS